MYLLQLFIYRPSERLPINHTIIQNETKVAPNKCEHSAAEITRIVAKYLCTHASIHIPITLFLQVTEAHILTTTPNH